MINRIKGIPPTDGVTDPVKAGNAAPAEKTPTALTAGPTPATSEQVALSPEAKLAQLIVQAAQGSNGVNSDLVQAIRKAVDSGQYTISSAAMSRAVAEVAWLVRK